MASPERRRQLSFSEQRLTTLDWDNSKISNNYPLGDFISILYDSNVPLRIMHIHEEEIIGVLKNPMQTTFVAENGKVTKSKNGRVFNYRASGYIAFVRKTQAEPPFYSVDVVTNYGLGTLAHILLPIKGKTSPLIDVNSDNSRLNKELEVWERFFPKDQPQNLPPSVA